MKKTDYIRYIFEIIKPAKFTFIAILLFILLEKVATFLGPYLSKIIFDKFLISKDYSNIIAILIGYSIFYALIECQRYISSFVESLYLEKSENTFREKTIVLLFKKSFRKFKKHTFGDLSTIFDTNIRDLNMYIITIVETVLGRPVFLILSFGYIFSFSPMLLILIVIEAIISFITITRFTEPLENTYNKKLEGISLYNRHLERAYNSYEDSRLNFISNISIIRLFKFFKFLKERNIDDSRMNSIYMFIQEFKGVILDIVALIISIRLVNEGRMTPGDYVAYMALKPACYGVFNGFTHLILNFKLLKVAIDGINDIIPLEDYKIKTDETENVSYQQPINKISMSNVNFNYNDEKSVLYSKFNFEFVKNNIYTIQGGNGVGKTTFLRLLTGLCKPSDGKVYINNNYELENISEESITEKIKVLSQHPVLYDDTLDNNINILSKTDEKTKKSYNKLVEILNMKDIFSLYKESKESNIYEVTLSGGQLKKICIARTLLYDSEVLIFDEPFAALDKDTKKKFSEYLNSISNDKIIIIISHHEECHFPDKEIMLTMELDSENHVRLTEYSN